MAKNSKQCCDFPKKFPKYIKCEMGIPQTKLIEMLGLSNARTYEIMNSKSEPSLKIGSETSRQLNIAPAIVLGV